MSRLTAAQLSAKVAPADLREVTSADLSNAGYANVEEIGACVCLRKLNLNKNALTDFAGVEDLRDLRQLYLSNNMLNTLPVLKKLLNLTVLNISHNAVTRLEGLDHLTSVLVANNNEIATIENLGKLTALDTLVISSNKLAEIRGLATLTNLLKLSLAHNKIKTLPKLEAQYLLKELRLNHNRILSIPASIGLHPFLRVLDLGSNLIREFKDIQPLSQLPQLRDLVLIGNPVASLADYRATVEQLVPTLLLLDREPTDKNQWLKNRKVNKLAMKISTSLSNAHLRRSAEKTKRDGKPAKVGDDASDASSTHEPAEAEGVVAKKAEVAIKSKKSDKSSTKKAAPAAASVGEKAKEKKEKKSLVAKPKMDDKKKPKRDATKTPTPAPTQPTTPKQPAAPRPPSAWDLLTGKKAPAVSAAETTPKPAAAAVVKGPVELKRKEVGEVRDGKKAKVEEGKQAKAVTKVEMGAAEAGSSDVKRPESGVWGVREERKVKRSAAFSWDLVEKADVTEPGWD